MDSIFSSNGIVKIKKEDLKEVIDFSSKKAVGKIMKRFEIFDIDTPLKKEVRELIYENFRDMENLIVATGYGLGVTQFNFKKGKSDSA